MIEQLGAASDAQLLASVVELEAELARLRYRQLAVLAELNSRNVPGRLGLRGLPDSDRGAVAVHPGGGA